MFLEPAKYPFTRELEAHWLDIRRELEQLPAAAWEDWPEQELYNPGGWAVFGLFFFGRKLVKNCAACPQTVGLLQRVPGMVTAGFSNMMPGAHIRPHRGYTSAVLRCHLGLVVPSGNELRVGSETRSWSEGSCLVFDDTTEHEAWNRSDRRRVVLLLDFKREAHYARASNGKDLETYVQGTSNQDSVATR